MKKVSGPQVVSSGKASEMPLPPQIQEALGELVGAAREGLLALSVGLGLSVVHELMEAEVSEVVGPKGKHDPDRTLLCVEGARARRRWSPPSGWQVSSHAPGHVQS